MPEAKKRRRPAKSCEQCRSRKVKCDQEEPCGPCSRTRTALACVYSADTVRESPRTPVNTSVVNSNQIGRVSTTSLPAPQQLPLANGQQCSLHLEHNPASDSIQQTSVSVDKDSVDAGRSANSSQWPVTQRHAAQSNKSLGWVPDTKSKRPTSEISDGDNVQPAANGSFPKYNCSNLFTELPQPRLRFAAEKTKLFGQSHWSHTARKVIRLIRLATHVITNAGHSFKCLDKSIIEMQTTPKNTMALSSLT